MSSSMMEFKRIIETTVGINRKLIFNPINNLLIGAHLENGIRFWDPPTGKTVDSVNMQPNDSGIIDLSRDGQFLISGTDNGIISLFKLTSDKWVLEDTIVAEKARCLDMLISHNDEKIIRVNFTEEYLNIELWDISNKILQRNFSGGFADFHPDKSLIAIRQNEHILLYDYDLDQIIKKLYVTDIAPVYFDSSGVFVITINAGGNVVLWNIQDDTQTLVTTDHYFAVNLAVSSNTNKFISISDSGLLRLYELPTGKLCGEIFGIFYQANDIAISSQANTIAVGGWGVSSEYIKQCPSSIGIGIWEID